MLSWCFLRGYLDRWHGSGGRWRGRCQSRESLIVLLEFKTVGSYMPGVFAVTARQFRPDVLLEKMSGFAAKPVWDIFRFNRFRIALQLPFWFRRNRSGLMHNIQKLTDSDFNKAAISLSDLLFILLISKWIIWIITLVDNNTILTIQAVC